MVAILVSLTVLAHPHSHSQNTAKGVAAQKHDWPAYGGGPFGDHYSALAQINRANVKQLEVAWIYNTGETGGLQTSPLIIDGILYGITPTQKIFALNAANGSKIWQFDPGIKGTQPDRGLAYWTDGKTSVIFAGVMNFVFARDAKTGAGWFVHLTVNERNLGTLLKDG